MGDVTERVEQSIRELIDSGKLGPDGRLPSERVLAKELDAGRTTIRLILSRLSAEGVIRSEHGRGYFVGSSAINEERLGATSEGLEPWKFYGERVLYDNQWVQLALVDLEPPGVERFEHHVVRLHHVAVAAVIDDEDRVLMLWRYRFVPDRWGWELPGGILDPGEDPATAAAREVEEETGWRPTSPLKHVLSYQPMIGMVDSPHEILVGRGAELVGDPTDAEEAGHVAWVPLAEVPGLIERDELLGSGTLVALLRALAFGHGKDTTSAR